MPLMKVALKENIRKADKSDMKGYPKKLVLVFAKGDEK
jgi:hypothetical protein